MLAILSIQLRGDGLMRFRIKKYDLDSFGDNVHDIKLLCEDITIYAKLAIPITCPTAFMTSQKLVEP
jgi:hypothetical protein